jgi:ribosome-binding factor A
MRHPKSHRPERLAALIHEELALALTRLIKDPRVGFVTITQVQVSPDGKHAAVSVSVLGTEDEKTRAMDGLRHAKGFLRTHLAETLGLRTTPDLEFALDRGLEHARRIDELLAQTRREDEGHPA